MHQRKLNQQECSYAVQYILFNDRSKQARSLIITCWSDDNKAHPLFRVLSVARMHAVNWIDCSRDNASNSHTNLLPGPRKATEYTRLWVVSQLCRQIFKQV